MFRNNKSSVNVENFGAGSVVKLSKTETWLVVPVYQGSVSLVNTTSFTVTPPMEVEDQNFLSGQETEALLNKLKILASFSDYTFIPKGIKFMQDF